MTNEDIVKSIQTQMNVAIALRMMARCFERFYGNADFSPYAKRRSEHLNKMAGLFTAHALKLIAANKPAVEQWMESRRIRLLYEDLLAMQHKAVKAGFLDFASEIRDFRVDLLGRYYSPLGSVRI